MSKMQKKLSSNAHKGVITPIGGRNVPVACKVMDCCYEEAVLKHIQ